MKTIAQIIVAFSEKLNFNHRDPKPNMYWFWGNKNNVVRVSKDSMEYLTFKS